jgi:hypothetical protein
LSDRVYEVLKGQLMDRVLAPGEKINIDLLCRELEVSQTPIREALARLESDGLVTKRALAGYTVAPLLDAEGYDDLFEMRFILEPVAAARAATPGNYDGNGVSFSEQALTAAGAAPGATVTSSGMSFTFPNVAAGTNDNTVANGQTIRLSGSASQLGFLISGSFGGPSGTATVTYTHGTQLSFTLATSDWWNSSPPSGGAVAVSTPYFNYGTNSQYTQTVNIFSVKVALNSAKTLASLTLPAIGNLQSGTPAMHVFAMATS